MTSLRLAVAAAATALAGCGGGPKMAPVSGTVTYPDGRPVAGGKLILHPDDPTRPSAVADIGPDGRYQVHTERPGDGAPLGGYKVTVQPFGDDYGPANPLPIDEKFADPNRSGFRITVDDKPNTLDLTVARPEGAAN